MLSVLRVHLSSDIPIVGCELTPYVLLHQPDKTVTTDDVPEAAPLDGHFLRYKWSVILFDSSFSSPCTVITIVVDYLSFNVLVQSDHYEEFFAPELDKHGYCGLYKGKTNEVVAVVFCFLIVEFNKAAQSLTDPLIVTTQRKTTLNRLVKNEMMRYLLISFFKEWMPVRHANVHFSSDILCPRRFLQLFSLCRSSLDELRVGE
ncbi:hypothetical protein RJT34_00678 [Clitoria ternatea]|uniref:Uncharacterized protein n=1 Tax=Clitoria ternatea TaxID=43366 RepID=A0AAN9Q2V6_CLITE